MAKSIYDKKGQIRPSRVRIRYDVQIGDAIKEKELPFVVGVVSDLSGKPAKKLEKLSRREFVEINRDNFSDIMQGMKPRLEIMVENLLAGDGTTMLRFVKTLRSIDDFGPDAIVQDSIEEDGETRPGPMQQLVELRNKLEDLKNRTEGNDRLGELLAALLDNEALREKLASAAGQGQE